jgi:4-hydroxy-tetrahydrodipicolinate synthase
MKRTPSIASRIIVPLVTPFDEGGEVDGGAHQKLVDYAIAEGADALMPTALTGEGPLLSEDETFRVWETVFEANRARRPILPAVISFTTAGAVRRARRAEAMGAEGLLLAPIVPELYAGRSERDVFRFHEDVAGATALPVILFNYPSLTGVDLTPSLVEKLSSISNVRGIKESTGDSRRISALMRRLSGRIEVICGAPTAALECLALGCRSWITGILNVVPRAGAELLRAIAESRDLELARRIYFERILPLVDMLDRTSNPTGTIKAGVRLRGIGVGVPRLPGQDLLPQELAELERVLSGIP